MGNSPVRVARAVSWKLGLVFVDRYISLDHFSPHIRTSTAVKPGSSFIAHDASLLFSLFVNSWILLPLWSEPVSDAESEQYNLEKRGLGG
jgi:hypothetical protein